MTGCRTKISFLSTPGRSRIVYLDEIPVTDLRQGDAIKLKEKVYAIMEEKLKAYKASWIEPVIK